VDEEYSTDREQRDAKCRRKQAMSVSHQSSPFARSTDVQIGEETKV
jgi:hypothetical protein